MQWLLFSLCLSQGTLPIQWKSAIVVTIHKKGSRDHRGNYRPISLTCVLCRVLEHIIANKLLHHFHCNNLLSVNQFGFLPGHSSCSQLLTVLNKWFSKYDNNDQVDIVYTDIAKAFDSLAILSLFLFYILLVLVASYFNGLMHFFVIVIKKYVSTILFHLLWKCTVVYPKAVSLGHYFLLFILMT